MGHSPHSSPLWLPGGATRFGTVAAAGGEVDLRGNIEALLRADFHGNTNDGMQPMTADAYAALWPRTVRIPDDCIGRFTRVMLVDLSVMRTPYIRFPHMELYGTTCSNGRSAIVDLTGPLIEDGRRLTRYVAFAQLGERYTNQVPAAAIARFHSDEVGLLYDEAVAACVQHWDMLNHQVLYVVRSRFFHEGNVFRFYRDKEYHHGRLTCWGIHASGDEMRDFVATRHRAVLPVSWASIS